MSLRGFATINFWAEDLGPVLAIFTGYVTHLPGGTTT